MVPSGNCSHALELALHRYQGTDQYGECFPCTMEQVFLLFRPLHNRDSLPPYWTVPLPLSPDF